MKSKPSTNKICLSFTAQTIEQCYVALNRACWCEFRFDLLFPLQEELLPLMQESRNMIFAIRQTSIENTRFKHFFSEALKFFPVYVDFDSTLIHESEIRSMIEESRQAGAEIIFSYHDYTETPDDTFLNEKVKGLFAAGADVVKVACLTQSENDCYRIMSLYSRFERLIAFGMGNTGSYTRLFSLIAGEKLTYVSPDNAEGTATGQYTLSEMESFLSLLRR